MKLWTLLPITYFITDLANGLQCYTCNSLQDPRCNNPSIHETLKPVECTWNTEKLIKLSSAINEATNIRIQKGITNSDPPITLSDRIGHTCQKIVFKEGNTIVTGRGCSNENLDWYKPCNALKLIFDAKQNVNLQFCDTCTTDRCNRSWKSVFSLYLLVLSGMLVILM